MFGASRTLSGSQTVDSSFSVRGHTLSKVTRWDCQVLNVVELPSAIVATALKAVERIAPGQLE